MKYIVRVNETQYWAHDFEVEAKSSEEALHLAEARFYEGECADDGGLDDAVVTSIRIKSDIDKEFFNRITNELLGDTDAKV